ncbi:hypothetical protein HYDPIDRAFT_45759, partial [Hydnomerulius pinastri MD-312]
TLLFEHSDVLEENLLPALVATHSNTSISDASDLGKILDESMRIVKGWDPELRARFIAGHPRIGETKQLSALSSKEQSGGTSNPTPPEVLERLRHLNTCYEHMYPGLRYITFVNGRSRVQIAKEMEDKLGIPHSLSPDQPPVESLTPIEKDSKHWLSELERAVDDVGRIASSRLDRL